MPAKPPAGQSHKLLMKSGIREPGLDGFDVCSWNTAFHNAQRKIHQIALAENFDQRCRAGGIFSDTVVHVDHKPDFGYPPLELVPGQICSRQGDRWRQVIKSGIRPNTKVVKAARDQDLLPFFLVEIVKGEAEMNHAIHMIPIPEVIVAEFISALAQDLFDQWYTLLNHATVGSAE